MKILENNPYCKCNFGDKRLTQRAVSIADAIGVKYGQPLSKIFKSASDLKRGYEFFTNPKTTFEKLTQPSFKQTALQINGMPVVLAVGDTSFLDYNKILEKRIGLWSNGKWWKRTNSTHIVSIRPRFWPAIGAVVGEVMASRKKSKNIQISRTRTEKTAIKGKT